MQAAQAKKASKQNAAELAQSAERTTLNRVVAGSIPASGGFFCTGSIPAAGASFALVLIILLEV